MSRADEAERAGLRAWAARLLEIREGRDFPPAKVQQALQASIDPSFSAHTMQLLGRELKRIGWDERDTYERLGISVAGTMAMLTSVGAIALAAFGSVFSVPMWIVFGSGDEFARILIDETDGSSAHKASAAAPGDAAAKPAAAPVRDGTVAPPESPTRGRRPAAAPEDVTAAPMVLINIGRNYRPGMDGEVLYELTRGAWRIGADKRAKLRYALAVADGEVREVYRIDAWHEAGTTAYLTRPADEVAQPGRWEFTGEVASASAREALLGTTTETLFKPGNANPIRYRNV
ncbi:MAG: hypothetical protein KDF95_17165 [Rhodocyclaceae bacterium]|nr:hypothetical protein [Rhodocyclaceae bacterium]